MKLAYTRSLEYFSPSSFMKFQESPINFYIERLGPKENRPPRDPIGMPQAVGLLFDELVKSMIENRQPDHNPDALGIEGALERSMVLAVTYAHCGAYSRLVNEGELVDSTDRCEVKVTGVVPGTEIPIMGYIDAVMNSPWIRPFPFDWKVTGAGTPDNQRSPNKGYYRLFEKGELTKRVHKLHAGPLEDLNEKWAIQMTFYGWMLGWGIEKIPYGLDQCTFSKGDVRIAQYRGWISDGFVRCLRERIVVAWNTVQEERVVPEGLVDAEFLRLIS